MGWESLLMAGTGIQTGLGVIAPLKQAEAGEKTAEYNAQVAKQRADEEFAIGQKEAATELRQAKLVQSSLRADAGASGAGANDKTVIDLFGDIGAEGDYNANSALAAGKARAQGIKQQADLGLWRADANSRLAKIAAAGSVAGKLTDAAGGYSKMRMKYGTRRTGTTRAWG